MKELEKIENKLEKIDERIDNIDKHLAVYNSQLRFHIKRTDMLEEEIYRVASYYYFYRYSSMGGTRWQINLSFTMLF